MDQLLMEALKNSGPQSAVFLVGIMFLSKMLKSDRSGLDDLTKTIREDVKENITAIQKLTLTITKLEYQVEGLTKALIKTEKLERDVHEAFAQIRTMRNNGMGN